MAETPDQLDDLAAPVRKLRSTFVQRIDPHRPSLWRYCLRLTGSACLDVENLGPVCYNSEGTRTIVPRFLAQAGSGPGRKTAEQIRREVTEGIRSGKYDVPRRPVVAYARVLLYAPFLRNSDVGGKDVGSGNSGLSVPEILAGGCNASVDVGSSSPRCLVRIEGPSSVSIRPRSRIRSTMAFARSSS